MRSAARAASVSVRGVLDTNVVVSGLLWRDVPRQLLDAARDGRLTAYTSLALLGELADVLGHDPLAALIARVSITSAELVYGYSKLARLATVAVVPKAARADLIVAGDKKHLLPMKVYPGTLIVSPRNTIERVPT